MYKKILVPLDGSKRAETILPHVEELAILFGASVTFLEVISPTNFYPTVQRDLNIGYLLEQQDQMIEKRKAYLSKIEGKFREKQISTKTMVEVSPIVSTIIEVAEHEGVDLIAMASHGRTGLSHVFYGSVAAGVLHRIDRPILLIRAEGQ